MTKVEQFIKDNTKNCSNELASGEYQSWLTPDQARRVAEIAKEETINKVCNWLADRCVYEDYFGLGDLDDLIKAMEE